MNKTDQFIDNLKCPIGTVEVLATDDAVTEIRFVDGALCRRNPNRITAEAVNQLEEFFERKRQEFELPLGAEGTEFQRLVWDELVKIPYGQTCSYQHIATQVNRAKAVRAVGAANGRNPLAIVVPCHRVIGSNGRLTGYAGGLERKEWLLELEGGQVNKNRKVQSKLEMF